MFTRRLLWKVEVNIQYSIFIQHHYLRSGYIKTSRHRCDIADTRFQAFHRRWIIEHFSTSSTLSFVQYIIYGNLSHASSAASPETQCAFCCKHIAVCIKGRKSPGKFPFNGPSPVLCLSLYAVCRTVLVTRFLARCCCCSIDTFYRKMEFTLW